MAQKINVQYLEQCIKALEGAYQQMNQKSSDSVFYEIYRSACVKEFEIILEQCGKLLRKKLRAWFASNKEVDKLPFKDVFRHSAKHGLINTQQSEHWLNYRDNRNSTAHDYGEGFAEETLKLIPNSIADSKALLQVLKGSE